MGSPVVPVPSTHQKIPLVIEVAPDIRDSLARRANDVARLVRNFGRHVARAAQEIAAFIIDVVEETAHAARLLKV